LKDLKQVTVLGMGLLGGSLSLAVQRSFKSVRVIGYSHRATTRKKAASLGVASEIADDIKDSVKGADIVILCTPIYTFEETFKEIGRQLKAGCIVTDVGSTKQLVHRWAAKRLPKAVHYVGSHPIAGSEQRGVEFSRDDLLEQAACIVTKTKTTNAKAARNLKDFWSMLGCFVQEMSPAEHDRIFAQISHLPHIVAASLVNANSDELLKFSGKGFRDTSRIASGPVNVWSDILLSNSANCVKGIDKMMAELDKVKKALEKDSRADVEKLLERARNKREAMIKYKLRKKELL
jgi:prephenate dehydrogenase